MPPTKQSLLKLKYFIGCQFNTIIKYELGQGVSPHKEWKFPAYGREDNPINNDEGRNYRN